MTPPFGYLCRSPAVFLATRRNCLVSFEIGGRRGKKLAPGPPPRTTPAPPQRRGRRPPVEGDYSGPWRRFSGASERADRLRAGRPAPPEWEDHTSEPQSPL